MKKWLVLLGLLAFLVACCAKQEIPTGAPEGSTAGVSVPESPPAEMKEPAPPQPVEEAQTMENVPPFDEEMLESPTPAWIDAHRQELWLYGRSTRPLKAIFFDFDSFQIREDMRPRLIENARYLLNHPEIKKVELQGNCDERGSSEYNLALGERRALAVKRFLVNLGVDPKRLVTVSFGEERPLDPRHNEEAWALNRRVDFVVVK